MVTYKKLGVRRVKLALAFKALLEVCPSLFPVLAYFCCVDKWIRPSKLDTTKHSFIHSFINYFPSGKDSAGLLRTLDRCPASI